MLVVYRAENLTNAALLQQFLEERGLRCGLRNALLQGALGELPLTLQPEVFVYDDADFEKARRCVAEFEAKSSARQDPIVCPRCGEENPGNFELCWKCRSDLAN